MASGSQGKKDGNRGGLPGWIREHQVGVVVIVVIVLVWSISLVWPQILPAFFGFDGSDPKTLWDWLELAGVPLVILIGGYLLNESQKRREEKLSEARRESDERIAKSAQEDRRLQSYFDTMTELMLEHGLGEAEVDDERIRIIARARTQSVVRRLSPEGKGRVLAFLYEAGLIYRGDRLVVDVTGLDLLGVLGEGALLSDAYLGLARLDRADLRGADLQRADLGMVQMRKANLNGAKLEEANFVGATLFGTDLRFASGVEKALWFAVRYDDETRWPEGFDPEAAGAKFYLHTKEQD